MSITAEEVVTHVLKNTNALQELAAKMESGERSAGDLANAVAKVAAAQDDLDKRLALAEATRAAANGAANLVGGDLRKSYAAPQRSEKGEKEVADGVRLFDTAYQRTIGGHTQTRVRKGLLTDSRTISVEHLKAKDAFEALLIHTAIRNRNSPPTAAAWMDAIHKNPDGLRSFCAELDVLGIADGDAVFKLFGVSTGTGGDWIPTAVFMPELERTLAALSQGTIAQLFRQKNLTAKNNYSPLILSLARPFLSANTSGTQAADFLKSDPTTGKLAWNPKRITVATIIDTQTSFDSILDNVAEIRGLLAESLLWGIDDAIMNGDTAATHQDTGLASFNPATRLPLTTGVGTDADHRRGHLGLRARALDIGANASLDLSGTFTAAKVGTMLGKFSNGAGGNLDRCALLVSNATYFAKIATASDILTVDKYGPRAPVLTGEVARVMGVPVVRSATLAKSAQTGATGAFNSSGINDSTLANNSKEAVVLVDLDRYVVAKRSDTMTSASQDNVLNGTTALVVHGNVAFESPDHSTALTSSSPVNVVYGYNL